MANLPAALRSLPLEHIIGSPLQAAIKAQALSARTTVEFIKEVGLKAVDKAALTQTDLPAGATADPPKDDEVAVEGGTEKAYEARYVEFKFDRLVEEQVVTPGAPPITTTQHQVVPSRLTVPILAILPIPFLRINDMNISFEYSIKDISTTESKSEKTASAEAKAKGWFVSANVKGSFTSQKLNRRETDQSATLKIEVNAVQDAVPEGLAKVLDLLQESMKVVPLKAPSVISSPALPPPAP